MTIKGSMRLLAAALCAVCIGGCARAEKIPELLEPAGVQLAAAEAVVGDMSKISVYNGAVVPHVEELYFTVGGGLEEMNAAYGQTVSAGDVLAVLDQEAQIERIEELGEQIDALRSEDEYAQRLEQLDREIHQLELEALLAQPDRDDSAVALKRLDIEEFELNAGMEKELRRMKLGQLEEERAGLQAELGSVELIAPFDGRVIYMKDVTVGDRVSAYEPLIYLADDTRMSIESEYVNDMVMVSAVEIYALSGDGRFEIEYSPMDTEEYLKRVLSGEELKSRFEFAGDFDGLSVGDYAAVCVVTGRVENALIIPRNSLYMEAGVRYVYVVEDGVRIRREVETGATNDWQVQIKSGLQEGERVYVQD